MQSVVLHCKLYQRCGVARAFPSMLPAMCIDHSATTCLPFVQAEFRVSGCRSNHSLNDVANHSMTLSTETLLKSDLVAVL